MFVIFDRHGSRDRFRDRRDRRRTRSRSRDKKNAAKDKFAGSYTEGMAVEAESDDEILDIDIPDEEEVSKTPTRSLLTPA